MVVVWKKEEKNSSLFVEEVAVVGVDALEPESFLGQQTIAGVKL